MTARKFDQLVQQEVGALPGFNAEALTERQLQAMRALETAKKHVRASAGKPAWVQKVADEELLTALAFVEEFNALEVEL